MMHYLIFFNTNALSMLHSVKTLGGRQNVTGKGFALKKLRNYADYYLNNLYNKKTSTKTMIA